MTFDFQGLFLRFLHRHYGIYNYTSYVRMYNVMLYRPIGCAARDRLAVLSGHLFLRPGHSEVAVLDQQILPLWFARSHYFMDVHSWREPSLLSRLCLIATLKRRSTSASCAQSLSTPLIARKKAMKFPAVLFKAEIKRYYCSNIRREVFDD